MARYGLFVLKVPLNTNQLADLNHGPYIIAHGRTEVLFCIFLSEFEEILRAWQWPFITSTVKAPVIPKAGELREQLGPVCRHLACLHLPYPLCSFVLLTSESSVGSAVVRTAPPALFPGWMW